MRAATLPWEISWWNQHQAAQRDVSCSWKQETQGISKKISTRSTEVVTWSVHVMAEAGGWGTQRKKACIRNSILYSNTWPLPLLITAMLRYVLWYCSSRSALISFFFTFRLVVKQRTPSFIILSKESSFRASFLQRYQVERWQKFRTVPYLTQLSSGKIELAFVRSSWKKPKSFRFSSSNQNIERELTSTP